MYEISLEIYLFQGILWVFRKNHYYPTIRVFSQNSFFFPSLDIKERMNFMHHTFFITSMYKRKSTSICLKIANMKNVFINVN
jgi:hypothetical protein